MSDADRDLALARACAEIEEVFAEKAGAVAREMAKLATDAESEAVRFQASREVIRQIRGEAVQRVEHRSLAVNFRGDLNLPMARINSNPDSIPALQAPDDGSSSLPPSSPSQPSVAKQLRRLELAAPETPAKMIGRMRKMENPATVGGTIMPEPHKDGQHERIVETPNLTAKPQEPRERR